MKVVDIKDLNYSYNKGYPILKDLSLSIEEGSYICLLGPNGSGKSTLSRLIVGLLKPDSGTISIFGQPLEDKNINNIRKKIGIVFQNPDNQFIAQTVEDDIAFGLENRCIDPSKMGDIIHSFAKKVGMEKYLEKEPSFLSGGQKQRVAIAGVLALNPEIIIFDEATSMLDPKGRKEIKDLIHFMRKDNPSLTIISITHDVEEAFLADYVYLLDDGHIVNKGEPYEVFKDDGLLNKCSLSLPFLYELKRTFSNYDIDINDCQTIEEVVNKLCQ